MMNLRVFLAIEHMTVKKFAETVGCDKNYISRIMNGKVKPSWRLARDIELLTGGQVKIPCLDKAPNKKENI